MDNKKPVKRSEELAPLSREHHDGLLFVWKIRQGIRKNADAHTIRKYALWYWKEHVKPHFFQEEKILLPYLPDADPLGQQLKNEHAQIRELVLSLDREAEAETFRILGDLVERHIRWEERTLFPHLEQTLSKEQLQDIHRELDAHPMSCEEWNEVFW